jgi:hypothetical protein
MHMPSYTWQYMPLSADTPPTARSPVFALCAACVLLLGFAAGGLWSANQVTMVPSAVPASMAVEGHNQRNALAANAHAQLRLSASGPRWREISEPQRQVLMPLRDRWDTIGALAKRRWLVLADRYPSMDESERNKLVSRMNTWASLSAQQRNQARINFESVKRLSAQELQSKWDEYQALSAAEKNRLAEQARKAKTAKKSKQRKLAQVPARGKAAPAAPAVAPPAAEVTTRPVATPAFVEALPVSTPQAAPSVHLTPLERKPQVATQPVAIPQATPSVELPPLPPVLHPEVTGTPHMRPLTDTHQPTHPVLPTAPTQIAPSPAQ